VPRPDLPPHIDGGQVARSRPGDRNKPTALPPENPAPAPGRPATRFPGKKPSEPYCALTPRGLLIRRVKTDKRAAADLLPSRLRDPQGSAQPMAGRQHWQPGSEFARPALQMRDLPGRRFARSLMALLGRPWRAWPAGNLDWEPAIWSNARPCLWWFAPTPEPATQVRPQTAPRQTLARLKRPFFRTPLAGQRSRRRHQNRVPAAGDGQFSANA